MPIAHFNRFEIELTEDEAESGAHAGRCDDDIDALLRVPHIQRQLAAIDSTELALELAEYGAWDAQQLADRAENEARVLWIACGHIVEEMREADRA